MHISEDAKDLITKLLTKDRKLRLGQNNDANEILSHQFFHDLDLRGLIEKKIQPDFIPVIDGLNNFDKEIINQKPEESIVPPEKVQKIHEYNKILEEFGFSAPTLKQENEDAAEMIDG